MESVVVDLYLVMSYILFTLFTHKRRLTFGGNECIICVSFAVPLVH